MSSSAYCLIKNRTVRWQDLTKAKATPSGRAWNRSAEEKAGHETVILAYLARVHRASYAEVQLALADQIRAAHVLGSLTKLVAAGKITKAFALTNQFGRNARAYVYSIHP